MMNENTRDIENVLYAQELIELCARLTKRLNAGAGNTTLDCRNIYCHKTGQPIGKRDQNTLEDALKLHGAEFVEKTLILSNGGNCHPLWIRTDTETLEKLIKHDPRGFAVFCLRMMTAQFYKPPHVAKRDILYRSLEQTWSCARAYQILGAMTQDKLGQLIDALQRCLTYNTETQNYIWQKLNLKIDLRSPAELAIFARNDMLLPIFESAVIHALKSLENWKQATHGQKFDPKPRTPSDMASKAPSQIRGLTRSKQQVLLDELLSKYGQTLDDPIMPAPGQEHWRGLIGKLKSNSSVSDYENLDFDAMPMVERKPDNKVEIQTFSRMLLADRLKLLRTNSNQTQTETQTAPIPPQTAPLKPMSLLARMRADKNKGK